MWFEKAIYNLKALGFKPLQEIQNFIYYSNFEVKKWPNGFSK